MGKECFGGPDECPKCSHKMSYTGGYCFKCGTYRKGLGGGKGRASGSKDLVDYFKTNYGWRIMKYWAEDHNEDLEDYL